jgi:hypothetical protein
MAAALLLCACFAASASAAVRPPDVERLSAALRAEGFAAPAVEAAAPPLPTWSAASAAGPAVSVDLRGLLDRHWSGTDSFVDAAGRTQVSGTLDLAGDGWLVVTPPGATPKMIKIESGMSGRWVSRGRSYAVALDVSVFRARLNNVLIITDLDAGAPVWRRTILELFRETYQAGEPVSVGGRPYRLFLARLPDASVSPAVPSAAVGLCFIYDEKNAAGEHVQYRFYRFPLESLRTASFISLFDGDRPFVRVSADRASLELRP